MKVEDQLIERLAELSRLEFNENEKQDIKRDLERILSFMEKLNEVNTEGVEPLIYVNEVFNVFREDKVEQTLSKEMVLKNAPMKDQDYFKVPKVIQQQ